MILWHTMPFRNTMLTRDIEKNNCVSSIIRDDVGQIIGEMKASLNALSAQTILVTGAAGFLGSYFLDLLATLNDRKEISSPCFVIGMDNFRSGIRTRVEHLQGRGDVRLLSQDITTPKIFKERIDWIIHLASIASPTFYRQFPLETIDTNVNGTKHMLELARKGAKSMLYLSSSEIYGDPPSSEIPTKEDYRGNVSCTGPRACYDESKRMAETLCTTYHRQCGVPVKIVRPFNVYGPGQRLDDKRVIPDLLSSVLKREPIVLYSNGKATRSFCYVRDAVRGMLRVLFSSSNGEAFNVGNDEQISIGHLAEKIADVAAPPRVAVEYRTSHDTDYLIDNPQRRQPDLTKLKSLNWKPEVCLADGLKRTIQSYRELMREGQS